MATLHSSYASCNWYTEYGIFLDGLHRNGFTDITAPQEKIQRKPGPNIHPSWYSITRSFWASIISTCGIILFLYSGSKFTAKFPEDFQLSPLQEMSVEVADYIKKEHPRTYMLYHYYPYLNLELGQDPFDWQHFKVLFKEVVDNKLPGNAIIVWDDWFSVMEGKVTLEMLEQNQEIEHVKTFKTIDQHGKERSLIVFKTKLWQ